MYENASRKVAAQKEEAAHFKLPGLKVVAGKGGWIFAILHLVFVPSV